MEDGTITDLTGKDGVARTMTFSKQVLPISETPKAITWIRRSGPDDHWQTKMHQHSPLKAVKSENGIVQSCENQMLLSLTP